MITAEKIQDTYSKAAIYYNDSDCVEYVRNDQFCIYERVDGFLTLVQDGAGNLIGFKLKGFRNVFTRLQKTTTKLSEGHFLPLISAIENVCAELGDAMFDEDPKRAKAYRAAYELAANDNVRLQDGILQAA